MLLIGNMRIACGGVLKSSYCYYTLVISEPAADLPTPADRTSGNTFNRSTFLKHLFQRASGDNNVPANNHGISVTRRFKRFSIAYQQENEVSFNDMVQKKQM